VAACYFGRYGQNNLPKLWLLTSSPRFYLGLLVKSQLRELGYKRAMQNPQKMPNDDVTPKLLKSLKTLLKLA
jgi:hypothetical protein